MNANYSSSELRQIAEMIDKLQKTMDDGFEAVEHKINYSSNRIIGYLTRELENVKSMEGERQSLASIESIRQAIEEAEFPFSKRGDDSVGKVFYEIFGTISGYFESPLEDLGGMRSARLLAELQVMLHETGRDYIEDKDLSLLEDLLIEYDETLDEALRENGSGNTNLADLVDKMKGNVRKWRGIIEEEKKRV